MKSKSLILIFISLGCGLVASIGIAQVMGLGSDSPEETEQETVKILVAKRNLTFSTELNAESVMLVEKPKKEYLKEEHITDIEEVAGMYSRVRLHKDAPILRSAIGKGDKKPVPLGYRLIPARVDSETITAQTRPGDFVDIKVILKKTGTLTTPTILTVLRRVEIYDVNNDTARETGEDGKPSTLRTVSFLIKEEHTNLVTLAKEMGKLRLLLRPLDEEVDDNATAQDSLSFGDFLNQQSQFGAKTSPDAYAPKDEEKEEPKEDFTQFVKRNDAPAIAAPAIREPAYETLVRGPDGAVRYVWYDLDELPEVHPVRTEAPASTPAAANEVNVANEEASPVEAESSERSGEASGSEDDYDDFDDFDDKNVNLEN